MLMNVASTFFRNFTFRKTRDLGLIGFVLGSRASGKKVVAHHPVVIAKMSITLEWMMSKLLTFLQFRNPQNSLGELLVECAYASITFDWLKIQKSYRHHWKAESCSFLRMPVAFLYLQPIKSYELQKLILGF